MNKIHYKVKGIDTRNHGQTEFEYSHQAACGYVRDNVTTDGSKVTCYWCLNSVHMINFHAVNKTKTDSKGRYR